MTAKQAKGQVAPDGSIYVTISDGAGSLAPGATANANGQATMANSQPVAIASNQSAVPISWAAHATGGASFLNIPAGAAATTVVKASAGTLYKIILNGPATATNVTTVYDHASGVGTIIAKPLTTGVTAPVTIDFGPMGLAFANGLTVITATANGGDMTFVYK